VPRTPFEGQPVVSRQVLVSGRHDRDHTGDPLGLGECVAETAEQDRHSPAQSLARRVQAAHQHGLRDHPALPLAFSRPQHRCRRVQKQPLVGVRGHGEVRQVGRAAGELVQVAPSGVAYGPLGVTPRGRGLGRCEGGQPGRHGKVQEVTGRGCVGRFGERRPQGLLRMTVPVPAHCLRPQLGQHRPQPRAAVAVGEQGLRGQWHAETGGASQGRHDRVLASGAEPVTGW